MNPPPFKQNPVFSQQTFNLLPANPQKEPVKQISNEEKRNKILDLINNPPNPENDDYLKEVVEHVISLSKEKYNPNFEYQSQQYCAMTGLKIEDGKFLIVDGYTIQEETLKKYFERDGTLDVSIGDIKFNSYQNNSPKEITIQLTLEVLEQIYGPNLEQQLQEAEIRYSKRYAEPIEFVCEGSNETFLISDMIQIGGKKVSIKWAAANLDQATDAERKYIEACKRNYSYSTCTSQSQRLIQSQKIEQF